MGIEAAQLDAFFANYATSAHQNAVSLQIRATQSVVPCFKNCREHRGYNIPTEC